MKLLSDFTFNLRSCYDELDKLEALLLEKSELQEAKDILPFFKENLNLAAYLGLYSPNISRIDKVDLEYSLYGDFRADAIIGDSKSLSFCLIEFEDATSDSIFKKTARSTSEWSSRFEHGFSQIVDWLWKIDDFRQTTQARQIFGADSFSFMGVLIIGRDRFLDGTDRARLNWRVEKTVVNSQKIVCRTFDQLTRDLRENLDLYKSIVG